jgi:hypothetical protein
MPIENLKLQDVYNQYGVHYGAATVVVPHASRNTINYPTARRMRAAHTNGKKPILKFC